MQLYLSLAIVLAATGCATAPAASTGPSSSGPPLEIRRESATSTRVLDPRASAAHPEGRACRRDEDCTRGDVCTLGYPTHGGAQPPPPPSCATDQDCAAHHTCRGAAPPERGTCSLYECASDAACPQFHSCTPQNSCQPTRCQADADCGDGYCVHGGCSARSGNCVSARVMMPA